MKMTQFKEKRVWKLNKLIIPVINIDEKTKLESESCDKNVVNL